jgi:hypothetical protein
MNDTITVILFFLDLVIGLLTWLYLNNYFNQFIWWKAALIKSLIYSLFFGIGALGEGGGDPGFMLPYPIAPAAIVALTESKFYVFVQNALLPYILWTTILFAYYCLKQVLRHLRKTRKTKTKKQLPII